MEDNKVDQFIGNVVGSAVGVGTQKYQPISPSGVYLVNKVTEDIAIDISNEYRMDLAGWLGDIMLADHKMSDDDYKADLDGVNISELIMNEDINTIEAVNEYYGSISNGTTTREKEFLCNKGEGNIEKGWRNLKIICVAYGGGVMLIDGGKEIIASLKGETMEKPKISEREAAISFFNKLKIEKITALNEGIKVL